MPLVVLGNLYGLWGTNMQHTAVNLIKTSWAPSNSWNFIQLTHHSFRSILPSLYKTFISQWLYGSSTNVKPSNVDYFEEEEEEEQQQQLQASAKSNHRLQQVADYQPGDCLKE